MVRGTGVRHRSAGFRRGAQPWFLNNYRDPPAREGDFGDYFQKFRRAVEVLKQKILIEAARRVKTESAGIVVLDASARAAIHQFIQAIRGKLDEFKLPENKRKSLFDKLNAFAAEVDRNRTRTEAICAFAVEVARAGRAVNDEIKPLQETIDRLFDMLDKAAKWKDTLPPWRDRKQIEPPQKQLPKPDLDDDIPF